mgnify:CR=1 FL=1
MLVNASKIDLDSEETIRQQLVGTEEHVAQTAFAELKSPTTVLLVSIFLGSLGIDRFILGQKFMGVLKLVTAGGCLIWTIIDWFTSGDRTRKYNTKMLLEQLAIRKETPAPADETPSLT